MTVGGLVALIIGYFTITFLWPLFLGWISGEFIEDALRDAAKICFYFTLFFVVIFLIALICSSLDQPL